MLYGGKKNNNFLKLNFISVLNKNQADLGFYVEERTKGNISDILKLAKKRTVVNSLMAKQIIFDKLAGHYLFWEPYNFLTEHYSRKRKQEKNVEKIVVESWLFFFEIQRSKSKHGKLGMFSHKTFSFSLK